MKLFEKSEAEPTNPLDDPNMKWQRRKLPIKSEASAALRKPDKMVPVYTKGRAVARILDGGSKSLPPKLHCDARLYRETAQKGTAASRSRCSAPDGTRYDSITK